MGFVQWECSMGFWISGFLDLFNVFSLNSKDWVNMVQLLRVLYTIWLAVSTLKILGPELCHRRN